MFPSLEIMKLNLHTEIWVLNYMLLLELIYFGCSFDILSGPYCFFLTANISTTSTKNIHFVFSSGLWAVYLEMSPHSGILVESRVESFEKRTPSQSHE